MCRFMVGVVCLVFGVVEVDGVFDLVVVIIDGDEVYLLCVCWCGEFQVLFWCDYCVFVFDGFFIVVGYGMYFGQGDVEGVWVFYLQVVVIVGLVQCCWCVVGDVFQVLWLVEKFQV